jgi:probable F420-dependent oxidoreductase
VSVIVLPMREPVLFAKQTATLDLLSGGRLVMGLGAGWNEREFGYLGADFATRGKRLDEYIRALRVLWTSPDPSFEGQYVSFSEALFSPRSPQPNGPPIVIGGSSRAALRRSATLADGWHATGLVPDEFAAGTRRIRELADGRQVELQIRLHTRIGEVLPDVHTAAGAVQATLSGSVDEVVARVEEYRAAGLTHLVSNFGGESVEGYLRHMRRFAEEVRPRIGQALNSDSSASGDAECGTTGGPPNRGRVSRSGPRRQHHRGQSMGCRMGSMDAMAAERLW